jgi:hypothetical protein
VVDPSEEALQREFSGVERTYIPMHAVVRVDEVEKRGSSKILPMTETGGKITTLPTPIYAPVKKDNKEAGRIQWDAAYLASARTFSGGVSRTTSHPALTI